MRRRIGIVVGLLAGLLGVGAIPTADAEGVRYLDEVFSDITTTKDVVYGQAVNYLGEMETLTLDVHEPAGDTAAWRAAVVWIHGGYFRRGTKEDYRQMWEQFARAGYVTVSINYRLNPTTPEDILDTVLQGRIDEYIDTVRDAQHDAQAAIRWVRANAQSLRVDPERIAVVGHSAGGLTTNMVAFNDHDPGTSGNPGYSSRVAAAVAMAGGSLPIKMVNIDPGEPPFLVVHGVDRHDRALCRGAAVVPRDDRHAQRVRAGAGSPTRTTTRSASRRSASSSTAGCSLDQGSRSRRDSRSWAPSRCSADRFQWGSWRRHAASISSHAGPVPS